MAELAEHKTAVQVVAVQARLAQPVVLLTELLAMAALVLLIQSQEPLSLMLAEAVDSAEQPTELEALVAEAVAEPQQVLELQILVAEAVAVTAQLVLAVQAMS